MGRDVSASKSPAKLEVDVFVVPAKNARAARHAGAQAAAEIDQCSIKSEHEMTSDLFDFHKLMEMENFGVKRYNNFVYKGQIDKGGDREGFGV